MKKVVIVLLVLLCSSCRRGGDLTTLREGDILFIETTSFQSKFVKLGMMSIWSHCGIAVNTPEGVQIMEADTTVRILPIEKFVDKSVGKKYIIKRPEQQLTQPIDKDKWLGKWYDLKFSFDNDEVYCSELVWLIYKEQGIELCPPIKINEHFMVRLPMMQDALRERGISPEQYAVAPCDLLRAL
ncbi:MAG: hypothetical protein IKL20_00565 [Alistipes sp.]|nr:hypothetical protein [Alistipes sp.]